MPIQPGNWPDYDIETDLAKDFRQDVYQPLLNLIKQRAFYYAANTADMKARFPAGPNKWLVYSIAEKTLWIYDNGWYPVWSREGRMTPFGGIWYTSSTNPSNPWAPIDLNNGELYSRYYLDPRNNIMDVHYLCIRGSSTNSGAGYFAFWSPFPIFDYRLVSGTGTVVISGSIMNVNVIAIDDRKFALNLTKDDARVGYQTKNSSGTGFSAGDTLAFHARCWVSPS